MYCLSCVSETNTERCKNVAAKSCIFCSKHMKKKKIHHWIDKHPEIRRNVIKFQSIWRGFYIRYILKLAGKGVLKRSICHNDEEFVTMESKTSIHPFDYFSFEQDGKVWCFDQKCMIEWSEKNVEVTNPFNRQKLSNDDVRRLRKLRLYRERKHLKVVHSEIDERTIEETRDLRWLRIVQIINECGMDDSAHPNHFIGMKLEENVGFVNNLVDQVREWVYTTDDDQTRKFRCYKVLKTLRNVVHMYSNETELNNNTAGLILWCLNELKDPTYFVFFILSAMVNASVLAADL